MALSLPTAGYVDGWPVIVALLTPLGLLSLWQAHRGTHPLTLFVAGIALLSGRALMELMQAGSALASAIEFDATRLSATVFSPPVSTLVGGALAIGCAGIMVSRYRRLGHLLRAERKFREAILSHIHAGVCVRDQEGRVLYMNTKAAQHFSGDYDPPRAKGQGRDAVTVVKTLVPVWIDEARSAAVATRTFEVNEQVVPAGTGGPRLKVCSWWDVSQWEHTQRVSHEFVSLVSHELRTPLTAIRGYLELVMRSAPLGREHREYLEVVQTKAEFLVLLVDDLLDLSHIESGAIEIDLREQNLCCIATEAAENMSMELTRRHIEFALELPAQPLLVATDRLRLLQILSNLLSNACKYTEPDGYVGLQIIDYPDSVAINVADTGMGIPEEEQPQVFSRFFRSSDAVLRHIPGTGLGLAITKALVERLGGQVSFHSASGKGTTFTVTLPKQRLDIQPGRPAGAEHQFETSGSREG